MLSKNVGSIDRVIRICIGIALIAMVFFPPHIVWGWVGLIPLATGLFARCPLYSLIGMDTCPLE